MIRLRRTAAATGLALLASALVLAGPATAAPVPASSGGTAAAGGPTSWVRAAHLVPGLGTMTISLVPYAGSATADITPGDVPAATVRNGARILASTAGYGTVGDYRQVPAGTYAVAVRPHGASPRSTPILVGSFRAKADQAFTLAALGDTSSPRIDTLSDDLQPPQAGKARVRLLPAIPDASAVTVAAQNGPVLAKDAAFGKPTGYAEVPAGDWTLRVTAQAEGTDRSPEAADVRVGSGGVYTVFVLADGSTGVKLEAAVDAAGMASTPKAGVQTGGGGAATRPLSAGVLGGLGLAGAGGIVLLGLAARRRPRPVVVSAG